MSLRIQILFYFFFGKLRFLYWGGREGEDGKLIIFTKSRSDLTMMNSVLL